MRKQILRATLFLPLLFCMYDVFGDDAYPPSIFVPRQLSYNPILENALSLDRLRCCNPWSYFASVRPVYTQSVGSHFERYFTIGNQEQMAVREDSSGVINPLWFDTISSNPTYYSSTLSFDPVRRTYGAMILFQLTLPYKLSLSFDTALITTQNKVGLLEAAVVTPGTAQDITVSQSLQTSTRLYGRVVQSAKKTGLDDIQVKLARTMTDAASRSFFTVYGLLGIPTGKGSKSEVLFEPLVGSKHAQLGLGSYYSRDLICRHQTTLSLIAELKWRYAFSAKEKRLFDLTQNGQWSRYLLLVDQADLSAPFFASNVLALDVEVKPKNSLDLYLALQAVCDNWQVAIGYDFWFRNEERIALDTAMIPDNLGIADLPGIVGFDPETASTANISQGVADNSNQMVSDASFVTLQTSDLYLRSAQAPKSLSNSLYLAAAYAYPDSWLSHIGLNVAYEIGKGPYVSNNIFGWITVNATF